MPIFDLGQNIDIFMVFSARRTISAVDVGTNVLTATTHGFTANDPVTLENVGGRLPGGITAGKTYYANVLTSSTITLALTPGGSAIDLTDAGSGLNYVYGPADPSGVTLTVEKPTGGTDLAYSIGDLTHDRTGFYHKTVIPAAGEDGTWKWRVTSTGAVAASDQGVFKVRRDATA